MQAMLRFAIALVVIGGPIAAYVLVQRTSEPQNDVFADIHFCWGKLEMIRADDFLLPAVTQYLDTERGITSFEIARVALGHADSERPPRVELPRGYAIRYTLETTDGLSLNMDLVVSRPPGHATFRPEVGVAIYGPERLVYLFDICAEPIERGG